MRLSSIIVSACLGLLAQASASTERRSEANLLEKKSTGACFGEQPPSVAPHKNFWGSLTKQETRDVLALLHSNETGFNLTEANNAGRYVVNTYEQLCCVMLTRS